MADEKELSSRRGSQSRISLVDLLTDLDELVRSNPLTEAPAQDRQEGGSFVLFRSQTSTFAAPVELVSAVLQAPPLGRLPQAPKWLRGVFYWGGDVVPLVTLAVIDEDQVGSVESTTSRCLVLGSGAIKLGLEVDEVLGVRVLELGLGAIGARAEGELQSELTETEATPRALGTEVTATLAQDKQDRLSESLRWRLVADHEDANADTSLDPQAPIRVLSLRRLLANKHLTQFANPTALELGTSAASAQPSTEGSPS